MADARTIARPYAKAAIMLAMASNDYQKWHKALILAAQVAKADDMQTILKDPNVELSQILEVFAELGKDNFDKDITNLLKVMGQSKRLSILPEVAEIFGEIQATKQNIMPVDLISAKPIDQKLQEQIIVALKRKLGYDINLNCTTDPNLLAGAVIKAQDMVLDGSVKGRLTRLMQAVGA